MFHGHSFRLASRVALFVFLTLAPFAAARDIEIADVKKYLLSAKSASYRDTDPLIVVDAASRTYLAAPPKTLSKGDRLWVVLVNVDTLRFVYKVQGTLVSYQPSQVPSPLGSIVLLTPPTAKQLGFDARVAAAPPPPPPTTAFQAVLNAFEDLRDELTTEITALREEARLDDRLRPLALERLTNEERRVRAAQEVKSWYEARRAEFPESLSVDRWCIEDPSGCGKPNTCAVLPGTVVTSAAARKLQEFAGEIAALFSARQRAIDEASMDFYEGTLAWKAYYAGLPSEEAAKHKNENESVGTLIDAAKDFHERIEKTLPAYQERFASAAKLLALIMDGGPEGRTPGVLVQSYSDLTFDEFRLSLGVEPAVPLPAPAGKDAPPAVDTIVSSLPIPVIGCCRLGFSLGVVGTSLTTKHWYLAPGTPDPTKDKIVAEGPTDSFDFSPAALAHFDYYFHPVWAVGGAVGLTTSSPVRTLAGASVSFGRRFRATLTGGVAVGSVPELNGDVVGASPNTAGSVTTTNVMKTGWFLGLTGSFSIP